MRPIKLMAVAAVSLLLLALAVAALPLLMSSSVNVAYSEKVNYETMMVADQKGWLEESNIQAKLVTGGIQAAEALITGSVDMAVMGDGPAVQLITKGTGAKIVARIISGEGVHRFIASSSILGPEDLEGKRVGLQASSSTHAAFLNWATENDVNASNITIVPMDPRDLAQAMHTGGIDAMAGSEPWAVNTENLCGSAVHEIGNSSGLGSTYPIVLVASAKLLRDNPVAIEAMVDVLVRATEFINGHWEESMQICSSRTGLSILDQGRCSAMQLYAVGFNQTDEDSIDKAAQAMFAFGKIDSLPVVREHTDLRFLPLG
jgi:NitT/TauT family transport system substrate-binding protein